MSLFSCMHYQNIFDHNIQIKPNLKKTLECIMYKIQNFFLNSENPVQAPCQMFLQAIVTSIFFIMYREPSIVIWFKLQEKLTCTKPMDKNFVVTANGHYL
jgi:hypothetical protein